MRIIELDASGWKTVDDFYDALLTALGAPKWHGRGRDALCDSMIHSGINAVEPPYTIVVKGVATAPAEIRDYVALIRQDRAEDREKLRASGRADVQVSLEIRD